MSRLNPKPSTMRSLFLHSGNQCAFPTCTNLILDSEKNYIGNICHIEAAEEGGERYNKNQSDEDRRSYDNLILLCRNHHAVTNDVVKYDVAQLKSMKKQHEMKALSVTEDLAQIFMNPTHWERINLPKNLNAIKTEIDNYFQPYEYQKLVYSAQELFMKLEKTPPLTRDFYANILLISESKDHTTYVDPRVVNEFLGTNDHQVSVHYSILRSKCIISDLMIDEDEYPTKCYYCFLTYDSDDTQAWLLQCIRDYYKNNRLERSFIDMVTELNFSLMDQ